MSAHRSSSQSSAALLYAALALTLWGAPLVGQSAGGTAATPYGDLRGHTQSATESSSGSLVLAPGDALKITVWRNPEISGEFRVTSDGTLADPFYMEIPVSGVPLAVVGQQLRDYLARFESNPRVLVEARFRVAVAGEVRQPKLYAFGPEVTITQAVMEAGGPTDRAHLGRVRLLRDGQTTVVNLTHPESVAAAMTIRSGDQILVTRRTSVIRDYVAPISSITSATVSILYLISRYF